MIWRVDQDENVTKVFFGDLYVLENVVTSVWAFFWKNLFKKWIYSVSYVVLRWVIWFEQGRWLRSILSFVKRLIWLSLGVDLLHWSKNRPTKCRIVVSLLKRSHNHLSCHGWLFRDWSQILELIKVRNVFKHLNKIWGLVILLEYSWKLQHGLQFKGSP